MALIQENICEAPWLLDPSLQSRGILHGFLGKPLDFSAVGKESSAAQLLPALGATELALVRQVHGDTIVELSDVRGVVEADGIIFPLSTAGQRVVVGVRSADCVPLILVGQSYGVVVHAGWRGLAAQIVTKAAQALLARDTGAIAALIGPCAGGCLYEVGEEVVKAIGETALATALAPGKFLLDLVATTQSQLGRSGIKAVHSAELCTISDQRFHSFRREGAGVGNNLAFVCTAASKEQQTLDL
jgi:YfiH family protein